MADADAADGPLHVLHVDDDPGLLERVASSVRSDRERVRVTSVERPGEALDALDGSVDCVVSGHELPGMDGLELLETVRERTPNLPFVLFTGVGSERLAGEAISAGADAYVPNRGGEESADLLLQRIETLVSRTRARTNYREIFEKAGVAMSIRDPETGEFLDANQQYCELMGYSRDEIGEMTSQEVGIDEGEYTTERAHDLLRETAESGERIVEWVNERRDGTRLQVESTLKPVEIDGRVLVLVSVDDVTDHRRREAELERKKDFLERTQRIARVGGWELDVGSGALRWTDEVKRIHGVPRDYEPELETAIEFYHPDDRRRVRRAVESAIEDGESFELNARLVTANDDLRWVYTQGEPLETDDGRVEIRGTMEDVTERRRREQRIRRLQHRTEELMRARGSAEISEIAVETAKGALGLPLSGIHLDDGDGVLRGIAATDEVNAELGEAPDYSHESESRSVSDVVMGVYESGETLVIDETASEDWLRESPMESGIIHPLGDHGVFIASSPEPDAFDETDEALAEVLATTTTAALDGAERERRYEAIFNRTFQFTGLMHPDGTLVEVNRAALEFAGVDRESVVGIPLWESPWFRSTEEARGVARESVEQASAGEFYRDELAISGAGETVVIDYSVRPVTDERGNVVLLVQEGRDITELKQREAELERKNQQLDEFASVVSHDLRNPLSVATGRLELARADADGAEESLEEVARALDRMRVLIDDLLELARQGRSVDAIEVVELETLAREAWGFVDTADARLRVDSSVRFEADGDRVVQLFENVFRNAVEHGGPAVTVSVGVTGEGEGFYVEDDGPGLPDGEHGDIFQAGTTTEESGTGFGLSIVERIVEAHGWSIAATEGVEGGSRFEITGVAVDAKRV